GQASIGELDGPLGIPAGWVLEPQPVESFRLREGDHLARSASCSQGVPFSLYNADFIGIAGDDSAPPAECFCHRIPILFQQVDHSLRYVAGSADNLRMVGL